MDFLRRHLFLILCGIGSLAGIALGVTGLRAMPAVAEEMNNAKRLYSQLDSLAGKPVNKAIIDREQARIDRIKVNRDAVVASARQLTRYKPLLAGVFPDGDVKATGEFRKAYAAAMQELLQSLSWETTLTAGGPAGSFEIDNMKERMRVEEHNPAIWIGVDPVTTDQAKLDEPRTTPAGVLNKAGAKENHIARAHMSAAQRRFCYLVRYDDVRPRAVPFVEFARAMRETGEMEDVLLDDCWHAQLGYWIYKDVIDAIVEMNTEAANAIAETGQQPWVGVLPIKKIISVRLPETPYVIEDMGGGALPVAAGDKAGVPPGDDTSYFTGTVSSDAFDTLQFSVKLIMDQTRVMQFVDSLCRDSFHTLLRVSYVSEPANRKMVGEIYGSDAVVRVVFDFETIMLAEPFRRWMPDETLEYYELNRPKTEEIGD